MAANAVDGNSFTCTERDILIVYNSDSGGHNIKIDSVADVFGRQDPLNDVNIAIAAGVYHVYGPFPKKLFKQSDGSVYIKADDATVKVAVIRY